MRQGRRRARLSDQRGRRIGCSLDLNRKRSRSPDLRTGGFREPLDVGEKRIPFSIDDLDATNAAAYLPATTIGPLVNEESPVGKELPCSRSSDAIEAVWTVVGHP